MTNTKERILEVALELFSVHGYEAVSVEKIADAVGIKAPSLYKHFKSKQDIFDSLLNAVTKQFEEHSVFNRVAEEGAAAKGVEDIDHARLFAANAVREQFKTIIHNPMVRNFRKLMVIEQFRNPEIAALATKRTYTDVLEYHTKVMKQLIKNKIFRKADPEIMAAQYCFPINVWLNLIDREPDREEEVMKLIEKHIVQFGNMYRA